MKTVLCTERYLADDFGAPRGRQCPLHVASMFALPGTATAIVWANASRNAQAHKPGPLGLIGGST